VSRRITRLTKLFVKRPTHPRLPIYMRRRPPAGRPRTAGCGAARHDRRQTSRKWQSCACHSRRQVRRACNRGRPRWRPK
jgi:hypothetical protein